MTDRFPVNISKLPNVYFRVSNLKENYDATRSVNELIKECYILSSVYACACAMFVCYKDIFVAIYVKNNEALDVATSRMTRELDEIASLKKHITEIKDQDASLALDPSSEQCFIQDVVYCKLHMGKIKEIISLYEKVEFHVRNEYINLQYIAAVVSEAAQIISTLDLEGYNYIEKAHLSVREFLINNGLCLAIETVPYSMIHKRFPKNYIYKSMNLSCDNYKENHSIYEDFKDTSAEMIVLKEFIKYPLYHYKPDENYEVNNLDFSKYIKSLINKGYLLKVKTPVSNRSGDIYFVEKYIATEKAFLEFDISISSEDAQKIRAISNYLRA